MEDIGLKTNKGSLKHRCVEAKTINLYASENPERCPLWAIIKYLALLPKNRTWNAFYLQPRKKFFGKAWFVNRPVGINHLRTAVGDLCVAAGLPGHYTNHSLHATTATKLYQNNIDEQIIMEITGHWSMAVQTYKRTSDVQRKWASRCLFRPAWTQWHTPWLRFPMTLRNYCGQFRGPWHDCIVLYCSLVYC